MQIKTEKGLSNGLPISDIQRLNQWTKILKIIAYAFLILSVSVLFMVIYVYIATGYIIYNDVLGNILWNFVKSLS